MKLLTTGSARYVILDTVDHPNKEATYTGHICESKKDNEGGFKVEWEQGREEIGRYLPPCPRGAPGSHCFIF